MHVQEGRNLPELLRKAAAKDITVGFDGYVDSIIKVKRQSGGGRIAYFDTMQQFGSYIIEKSQRSCSLELKVIKEKIGGNMPIYSKCLARLGMRVNCVGAMGWPEALPLFQEGMGPNCQLHSIAPPGICEALEFRDGKVMLARNEEIERLDYPLLRQRMPPEVLAGHFARSDAVAFLNWSEMKGASSIWRGMLEEVLPQMGGEKRLLFVDLSDCSHHCGKAVMEMAELLSAFNRYFRLTVSLNRNETEQLCTKLGLQASDIREGAGALRGRLGCDLLIVHLQNGCYAVDGRQRLFLHNVLIETPKLLTGGGDNFNAGFTFATLSGLELKEALCVANAVSGYYVSTGHSPTRRQLLKWIEENHYLESS